MTINEKPWTRPREVCQTIEYGKATKTPNVVRHLCSRENYAHKWQLIGFVSETKPVDWPKELQKYDIYTCQLPLTSHHQLQNLLPRWTG